MATAWDIAMLLVLFLGAYLVYRVLLLIWRYGFVPESARRIIQRYPLHDIGFDITENKPFLAETPIFHRAVNFIKKFLVFFVLFFFLTFLWGRFLEEYGLTGTQMWGHKKNSHEPEVQRTAG